MHLNIKIYTCLFNPLSPYDALKHHFTSLKTDLIFLQQRVLGQNFHETNLPIHGNFLQFLNHMKSCSFTTSRELRQNSRLVVNEHDNGKFRLERVKHQDSYMSNLKLNKYE